MRKEAGYCCVQYYPCSDTGSWSISHQAATAQTSTNCITDFLLINGAALTCSDTNYYDSENKFCGAIFSAAQAGTSNAAICGKYKREGFDYFKIDMLLLILSTVI